MEIWESEGEEEVEEIRKMKRASISFCIHHCHDSVDHHSLSIA